MKNNLKENYISINEYLDSLKKKPKIEIDEEGMENLVNFFSLLLKVDMRNNPECYRKNKNKIS